MSDIHAAVKLMIDQLSPEGKSSLIRKLTQSEFQEFIDAFKSAVDEIPLQSKDSLIHEFVRSKFHDTIRELFPAEGIEVILEDFNKHYAGTLIPEAVAEHREGKIPSDHDGYYLDALLEADFLDYDEEEDEDGGEMFRCEFRELTPEEEKNADWLGVEEPLFRKYLGRKVLYDRVPFPASDGEEEESLLAEGERAQEEYDEEEGRVDEETPSYELQGDLQKLERDFKKRRPVPSYHQKELEKAELRMCHCADIHTLAYLVERKMYCEEKIKRTKMGADENSVGFDTEGFDMGEYRRIYYKTLDELFPMEEA